METVKNELRPIINNKKDAERLQRSSNICYNCHRIVYDRRDENRGELFCQECGYISNVIMIVETGEGMETFTVSTAPENIFIEEEVLSAEVKRSEKFKKIETLQKKYERPTDNNMKLWRQLGLYRNYIGIVNTEFMMTPEQKEKSYNIIKNLGDLQILHRQCGYEQIVTAICIYVMRKDKRDIRINRQRFLKNIGLNNVIYHRIIENMAKFFEEKSNIHRVTKQPIPLDSS